MRTKLLAIMLLASLPLGCKSPHYADRGAAVGALTGALAGGAIGKHNGNTAAGALIGGAVGALTGAAVGESIDADIARNNAIIEQRMGRQLAGAVNFDDVIAMSQASLSDEVIITHIQANGVAQRPQPADLITLSSNGVSDAVIKAMQTTPPPTAAVPEPSPPPVIVEEHHYVTPVYPRPPLPVHYRHRHAPARNSFHWGVTFSN